MGDSAVARKNRLPPHGGDTLGPYFPRDFIPANGADLLSPKGERTSPEGVPMRLTGVLRDVNGDPVPSAVVEFWQADKDGRYWARGFEAEAKPPPFHGFGRQYVTDGRYLLLTVKPGAAIGNNGAAKRAPNIALTIFCDGISRLLTQVFFEDEPLNRDDEVLGSAPVEQRPRLIARRSPEPGPATYELDLVLRGEDETPFFDDAPAPADGTHDGRRIGRRLLVGATDDTSATRTPIQCLIPIPAGARTSFEPRYPAPKKLATGENDLTRRTPGQPRAAGEAIAVRGRVVDAEGRPQRGVLIEIWSANARGRYDHPDDPARTPLDPHFCGRGRVLIDHEGCYRFLTIRPAAYLARPDIDRWRPSHVHLSLIGGATRLVTQMYFPDDPLQAADPSFQLLGKAGAAHIAKPAPRVSDDVEAEFVFDIVTSRLSCGT